MTSPFWIDELKETLMAVIGLSAAGILLILAYLVWDVTTRPIPCEPKAVAEIEKRWPTRRINSDAVDTATTNRSNPRGCK